MHLGNWKDAWVIMIKMMMKGLLGINCTIFLGTPGRLFSTRRIDESGCTAYHFDRNFVLVPCRCRNLLCFQYASVVLLSCSCLSRFVKWTGLAITGPSKPSSTATDSLVFKVRHACPPQLRLWSNRYITFLEWHLPLTSVLHRRTPV